MEKELKILKLPAYHAPEQISSSHLSKDLEEAYVNAGIVTELYVPTPTRGISKEVRKEYKKKKYEEKYDGKIIVHRFSLFKEGRNPILRAVRYLLSNLIQYRKGVRAKGIDLILGSSTPPTQGMLCARRAFPAWGACCCRGSDQCPWHERPYGIGSGLKADNGPRAGSGFCPL